MNVKKLTALFLATMLSAALLVGCGSDSAEDSTPKTVTEMFDIVSAANPISNPRDLDDMSIELDFMVSLDSIVEYKGVASNDGGDAGMVIVIETKEGEADAVLAALETYASNQVLFWSNYEEFADAKASVEDAVTVCEGNYIIQVFASADGDYTDIATAITEALG